MNQSVKELLAISASVGAHCQPCLDYHIHAAIELGVKPEDIRQAIGIGHMVEKGAMAAMKKYSTKALEELAAKVLQDDLSESRPGDVSEGNDTGKRLLIYDPAMCCASGVCGPSVDPVLAQFAGTLNFIAKQPGIHIERYNLGQQPRAFVENPQVKALLSDGGEKRLPFIFVNDHLCFQGHYPSREELLQALGIESGTILMAGPADSPCCGGGGCC